MANENQTARTTLHLILAWGFVGIPLAWGVIADDHQCDEAVPVTDHHRKRRVPKASGAALFN